MKIPCPYLYNDTQYGRRKKKIRIVLSINEEYQLVQPIVTQVKDKNQRWYMRGQLSTKLRGFLYFQPTLLSGVLEHG